MYAWAEEIAAVRRRKLAATQRLLGDTIRIDDDSWQRPTKLPGWTRAHVATHLCRNADALARITAGITEGRQVRMYDSPRARDDDIERGSERSGLDLQIDLDSSAGRFSATLDRVNAAHDPALWDATVLFKGTSLPLRFMPIARLAEVIIHHVDLDCGFSFTDIDDELAGWLVEWMTVRSGTRPGYPGLRIDADSGFTGTINPDGLDEASLPTVSGPDGVLVGWLAGRLPDDAVEAPDGVTVPKLW